MYDNVKTTINKRHVDEDLTPLPDMFTDIKSLIDNMEGNCVILITQKRVTASDIDIVRNILIVIINKIFNDTFLTNQEKH